MSRLFPTWTRCAFVFGLMFFSLLLVKTDATASVYTYNFLDFPSAEVDSGLGGHDTISGTIQLDIDSGPVSPSNVIGGTISISNPHLTSNASALLTSDNLTFLNVQATPTALILNCTTGGESSLSYENPSAIPVAGAVSWASYLITWIEPSLYGYGGTESGWDLGGKTFQGYGGITQDDATVAIATAQPSTSTPEPATLTVWALLGLAGVVCLRRHVGKEGRLQLVNLTS